MVSTQLPLVGDAPRTRHARFLLPTLRRSTLSLTWLLSEGKVAMAMVVSPAEGGWAEERRERRHRPNKNAQTATREQADHVSTGNAF